MTWTRQVSAKGAAGTFSAVSRVTAADCVAVGSGPSGNGTDGLSAVWNGTTWTLARPA